MHPKMGNCGYSKNRVDELNWHFQNRKGRSYSQGLFNIFRDIQFFLFSLNSSWQALFGAIRSQAVIVHRPGQIS